MSSPEQQLYFRENDVAGVRTLNGWIQEGDRVAIATRSGNHAEQVVGTVKGLRLMSTGRVRVIVDVEATGDSFVGSRGTFGCEVHSRIARLGPSSFDEPMPGETEVTQITERATRRRFGWRR